MEVLKWTQLSQMTRKRLNFQATSIMSGACNLEWSNKAPVTLFKEYKSREESPGHTGAKGRAETAPGVAEQQERARRSQRSVCIEGFLKQQ